MNLLVRGNSKIGREIWQWSIPAGSTCPGRTELCDERCYAQKGFFTMPNVKSSLQERLRASRRNDFETEMIAEIKKITARVIRIHVAGDYYSLDYIDKWHNIVKACRDVTFFTYTRSWRVPELRRGLTKFAGNPNLRLWYSIDQETGLPGNVPSGVRLAYMSVASDDIPPHRADLVFRDYNMRKTVQKRINGVQVCPPENGVTDISCQTCGICWNMTTVPKGPPEVAVVRRRPLPLVA